jgi:ADP-ribose diphosphatase
MPRLPKVLETKEVARSRLFAVEALELEFSNGERRSYERLMSGKRGAIMAVPMPDPDTILLVCEYAAGLHRYELGLGKGRFEADETVEQCVNRELREEIGLGARRFDRLTTLTLAPAYMGAQTHVVLARDLYEEKLVGDEPEEIEVVPWKLAELDTLVASGECSEARSIAALYLTREWLANEEN